MNTSYPIKISKSKQPRFPVSQEETKQPKYTDGEISLNAHGWRRWAKERGYMFEKDDIRKIYQIVNPLNCDVVKTLKFLAPIMLDKEVDERNEKIYQRYLILAEDPKPTKLGRGKTKAIYMELAKMSWKCGDKTRRISLDRIRRIINEKKENAPKLRR